MDAPTPFHPDSTVGVCPVWHCCPVGLLKFGKFSASDCHWSLRFSALSRTKPQRARVHEIWNGISLETDQKWKGYFCSHKNLEVLEMGQQHAINTAQSQMNRYKGQFHEVTQSWLSVKKLTMIKAVCHNNFSLHFMQCVSHRQWVNCEIRSAILF